jgi:hypothetical protein
MGAGTADHRDRARGARVWANRPSLGRTLARDGINRTTPLDRTTPTHPEHGCRRDRGHGPRQPHRVRCGTLSGLVSTHGTTGVETNHESHTHALRLGQTPSFLTGAHPSRREPLPFQTPSSPSPHRRVQRFGIEYASVFNDGRSM